MGFFPWSFEPHFRDRGKFRAYQLLPPNWTVAAQTHGKALNQLHALLSNSSGGFSEHGSSDCDTADIHSDRQGENSIPQSIKSLSCLISLS